MKPLKTQDERLIRAYSRALHLYPAGFGNAMQSQCCGRSAMRSKTTILYAVTWLRSQ